MTVNGRPLAAPFRDFEHGARLVTIEVPVDLTPGENLIAIVVTDGRGRRGTAERRVTRSLEQVAFERWAVVIGVRTYQHVAIPARRFATNDARAMADLLVKRGGFKRTNVRVMHDGAADMPVLANITDALGPWLAQRVRPRDTVMIYFAGRGAKDDDRAYLLPRDADPGVPEKRDRPRAARRLAPPAPHAARAGAAGRVVRRDSRQRRGRDDGAAVRACSPAPAAGR